jgi:hypothetical protein
MTKTYRTNVYVVLEHHTSPEVSQPKMYEHFTFRQERYHIPTGGCMKYNINLYHGRLVIMGLTGGLSFDLDKLD